MQGSMSIDVGQLDELIAAIFVDDQTIVYSAYSELGKNIQRFDSSSDLARYAESALNVTKGSLNLAVQYPESGPPAQIREITLNPEKCGGHTFRYSANGWGLIQVQCDAKTLREINCQIAVNTEKRALKWLDTYPELGDPGEWNWPVVEKHARRLIRVVKKLAGRTAGTIVQ